MLIENCVQNEDGSLDFDFHVSPEEAGFLMDYAIKDLIHHGIVRLQIQEAEQQLVLLKEEGGTVQ